MRSRRQFAAGLLAVATLAGLGTRVTGAADAQSDPRRSLVVLGDSISAGYGIPVTRGWVALLGERLAQRGYGYRVINASVSGETTAGALARTAHVLATHNPAIVLIELGGNDGLRGLPVAQTRDNLERLVRLVQDSGAQAVVIGMRVPPNYGATYERQFAGLYAQVAGVRHAALVPFLLAGIAQDDANFQADRIHPVVAVQPKLLDEVWPVLEPLLATTPRRAPAPAR